MSGAAFGVDLGRRGCPELGENLCGGGSGGSIVWVGDVGNDTVHQEDSGQIPPQVVLQADRKKTLERAGQWVGVVILEDGNQPYPQCHKCNMFMTRK